MVGYVMTFHPLFYFSIPKTRFFWFGNENGLSDLFQSTFFRIQTHPPFPNSLFPQSPKKENKFITTAYFCFHWLLSFGGKGFAFLFFGCFFWVVRGLGRGGGKILRCFKVGGGGEVTLPFFSSFFFSRSLSYPPFYPFHLASLPSSI